MMLLPLFFATLQFNTSHTVLLPLLQEAEAVLSEFLVLPNISVHVVIPINTTTLWCHPTFVNITYNNTIAIKTTAAHMSLYPQFKQPKVAMILSISPHYFNKNNVYRIVHHLLHGLGFSSSIFANYYGLAAPLPNGFLFDLPTLLDVHLLKNGKSMVSDFWLSISKICTNITNEYDLASAASSFLRLNSLYTLDMRITNKDVYTIYNASVFVFNRSEFEGFKPWFSFQHLNQGFMQVKYTHLYKNDSVFDILCGFGFHVKYRNCTKSLLTPFIDNCTTTVSLKDVKSFSVESADPRSKTFLFIYGLLSMLIVFCILCLFRIYQSQKMALEKKMKSITEYLQ